jgi:hypothetical protein
MNMLARLLGLNGIEENGGGAAWLLDPLAEWFWDS